MRFYKIVFHSFPHVHRAHALRTATYRYIDVPPARGQLGYSLHTGFDIIVKEGDDTSLVPSGSFVTCIPGTVRNMEAAEKGVPGYMSSLVVKGNIDFETFYSEEIEDMPAFLESSKQSLLLPFILPLGTAYTEIEQLCRLAVMHFANQNAAGQLGALSDILEITAKMDTLLRQTLAGSSGIDRGEYYSNKVKKYLETHYAEKISVPALADMLHISPSYLCRKFKESTGKTLVEYTAILRLYHARCLAYEEKLTTEEIARRVGVCNANYLNLLFKRYYGTNLRDCLLADREISLYHDRPF